MKTTDPLPFVHQSHVQLELILRNEAVKRDVAAKLKLELPIGASVKKFELQKDDTWYPATAVPLKKARAVVYKEKEKGRAVAAVSNSAVATNVFEMEISPLPHGKETLCRLEILVKGDSQELVDRLKTCADAILVEQVPSPIVSSSDEGAVVGQSFGNTHFVCKVPTIATPDATATNPFERVAVFWDSSASMQQGTEQRCARLQELFEKAKTSSIDLYTFGMGPPIKLGTFSVCGDCMNAIQAISYDGGTDLTLLSEAISQLARLPVENAMDAVLVFTDGVDNLGRSPQFDNSIPFSVHCIADVSGNINLPALKTVAAASTSTPGSVLTKSCRNYLQGVLFQHPVLQSIQVDQDEDAFMEETDDGFACIPDHRLQVLNEPIPTEGMCISGVLGDTVTKLTATVVFGKATYTFHYKLRETKEEHPKDMVLCDEGNANRALQRRDCPTVFLESADHATSRILGHIYAEEAYGQAEAYGIKSGSPVQRVKEDLAVSYGFCSPESTLLMLYAPAQFEEHGIQPPTGHPAAKDVHPKKEGQHAYANGEVGGLKNEQQKKEVISLAKRMEDFFAGKGEFAKAPVSDPSDSGSLRRSGFLMGSMARSSAHMAAPSMPRDEEDSCDDEEDCDYSGEQGEECGEEEEEYGGGFSPAYSPTSPRYSEEEGEQAHRSSSFDHARTLLSTRRCSFQTRNESSNISNSGPVSAAKDPKAYMDAMEVALSSAGSGESTSCWKQEYERQLQLLGGHKSASPSFFLNVSRALIRNKKPLEAIAVSANCLESGLEDVQMLRSVGYVLLSTETTYGLDLAIQLFDKVRELAPLEPQSFMDASLARFWKCFQATQNDSRLSTELLRQDLVLAQQGLVCVLTRCWAQRFREVEWPALILLHYISDLAKELNTDDTKMPVWPTIFDDKSPSLQIAAFDPSLMVWLGWDTDKTDVDLHIVEPSKREVYYSKKRGKGSLLSRDFTEGYGPEVYMAKHGVADAGSYEVLAKYYASHQDSALTGTTSAVVWTIESEGENGKRCIKFDFVRLDTHKEKTKVATATVSKRKQSTHGRGLMGKVQKLMLFK